MGMRALSLLTLALYSLHFAIPGCDLRRACLEVNSNDPQSFVCFAHLLSEHVCGASAPMRDTAAERGLQERAREHAPRDDHDADWVHGGQFGSAQTGASPCVLGVWRST